MIKITVCDDCESDIMLVRSAIDSYSNKKRIQFSVNSFSKPDLLLFELQDGKISDIYILDVSMPVKDGFELAKNIREYSTTAIIIFLTSHDDLAVRGYESKALRYVIKLHLEPDLEEALDCAVSEMTASDNDVITLHRYNDYWRIPYSDIICVNRISRQLVITTDSYGDITDSRGIKQFFDTLNDRRFIFIDRSCFVNIDYISQITGYSLRLKNGMVLPISRRSMQNVKQILLDQWGM